MPAGVDVLVLGGGVIGCSIAYHLRQAGVSVTLLERDRVGSGASSAAAGMLAPLAESHDPGPFSLLALQGLEAFHAHAGEIIDESGIDFEFRRDGILRVAESPDEEARLRGLLDTQPEGGPDVEWLDRRSLGELEPSLSPAMRGALYTSREGHVNPARLTAALAAAAARRGARLIEGWAPARLERSGDRVTSIRGSDAAFDADAVVLAGGAWTAAMGAELGVSIPIAPVRGQMAAIQLTPAPIRRIVYSHDGYLVPKADGSIYVGATEEPEAAFDAAVTVDGLRWLLDAAGRLVPSLTGAAYLRSWAGLRPCAPDRLPILGPLPGFQNVYVATGHFRNGILLSLITGRLIAQLLTTAKTSTDLTPFLPSRFHH